MFSHPALATRAIALPPYRRFTATAATYQRSLYRNRCFTTTTANMGVTKTIIKEGNGPKPVKGQTVSVAYEGWQKDENGKRGEKFDSSIERDRDLVVEIGVGQLIRGWDEGILTMRVGEKAILDITSDYGYGERGYLKIIQKNADLVFEVELKKIQ